MTEPEIFELSFAEEGWREKAQRWLNSRQNFKIRNPSNALLIELEKMAMQAQMRTQADGEWLLFLA